MATVAKMSHPRLKNVFVSGSRSLFKTQKPIFSEKIPLKMGPTELFTFKNCFATMFLVFSNKHYPNEP